MSFTAAFDTPPSAREVRDLLIATLISDARAFLATGNSDAARVLIEAADNVVSSPERAFSTE